MKIPLMNRNTITNKIAIAVAIPLLALFIIVGFYTANLVSQSSQERADLQMQIISHISAFTAEHTINSVCTMLTGVTKFIDSINPSHVNARNDVDEAVKWLLAEPSVYNAWVVFEPNAFDGLDAFYAGKYASAPSGRLMRSFALADGEIIELSDMDEATVDDPLVCSWYTDVRDDPRMRVSTNEEDPYDYGTGEGALSTVGVVAPLFSRDGSFIGCVGADITFEHMLERAAMDGDQSNIEVALFYPSGEPLYHKTKEDAGVTLQDLGFRRVGDMLAAMESGSVTTMTDTSARSGAEMIVRFEPIYSQYADTPLTLFTCVPRARAASTLFRALPIAIAAFILLFVAMLTLTVVITRRITRPIKEITIAAQLISEGVLEASIPVPDKTSEEISYLSRSLYKMVEKFRIHIMEQEYAQNELTVYAALSEAINLSKNRGDAAISIAQKLTDLLSASRVRLIVIGRDGLAVGAADGVVFKGHEQCLELIGDRNILFYNQAAIARNNISFVPGGTSAVWILPLFEPACKLGYLIAEFGHDNRSFNSANVESTLTHVRDTLKRFLRQSFLDKSDTAPTEPVRPVPNPPAITLVDLAREVPGLDPDAAIIAMGGLTDLYRKTVAITARVLPETADRILALPLDTLMPIAVEVHGVKSALYSIGAYPLANDAAALEVALKAGSQEAAGNITPFCEQLRALGGTLSALLPAPPTPAAPSAAATQTPARGKDTGLASALLAAVDALESFDPAEALLRLEDALSAPLGTEAESLIKTAIAATENFDYEEAVHPIRTLMESLSL